MQAAANWEVRALTGRSLGHDALVWNGLLHRMWGSHPMLHGSFIDGLLTQFGTGNEVLCIGRDPLGEPVGACILVPVGLGRWRTFLPSQLQIGAALMATPIGVERLMSRLPGLPLQVDFLCNDPKFGDLRAPDVECTDHALTMSIHLDGGFGAYWDARPNKLRQNMRRYARKLAAHGEVRLDEISDERVIEAAVRRYALIESAGWKGREGTALAPGTGQEIFYSRVMREFAARGEATAFELWAGPHHVASRLAILQGEFIVMLKTTYDERFAEGAPGRVLLERTLSRLFATHAGRTVEFYTDASDDQIAWATETRAIRHVTHLRWPWLRRAKLILKRATRTAALPRVDQPTSS